MTATAPPAAAYDAVVIGAGVAGLSAAVRAAEAGARVLVLAKGIGSTHLAPGTIDVLGYAPERIDAPGAALPAFVRDHPDHPTVGLRSTTSGVRSTGSRRASTRAFSTATATAAAWITTCCFPPLSGCPSRRRWCPRR
jgi:anaerobic glycerol-3-phosphate dehydrogenase